MDFRTVFQRPSTAQEIPLLPLYRSQPPTPFVTAPPSPVMQRPLTMKSTAALQSDPLLRLSREETYLQSTLQGLLDAQSEGLTHGLTGRVPQDETCSDGSTSPMRSAGSRNMNKQRGIVPSTQPTKRRIGLRGARRGILRTINDLASLKEEHVILLGQEISQREAEMSTIEKIEKKSDALKKQIDSIGSEDTSRRIAALAQEEVSLKKDILETETKLYEMKARHRYLLRELDGLNNRVQSKLSSYKSSLALTEKDISTFLSIPPPHLTTSAIHKGLWSLPRERRTLEMAREHYSEQKDMLSSQLSAVSIEKTALHDGAILWEEVVQDVTMVENLLREEMKTMQTPLSQKSEGLPAVGGMESILNTLEHVKSQIENKLEIAEKNGWNLLVCCIGAEFEAIREGQVVLEDALRTAQGSVPQSPLEQKTPGADGNPERAFQQNESSPANVVDMQGTLRKSHELQIRPEEDSDEPRLDLLISHEDED